MEGKRDRGGNSEDRLMDGEGRRRMGHEGRGCSRDEEMENEEEVDGRGGEEKNSVIKKR